MAENRIGHHPPNQRQVPETFALVVFLDGNGMDCKLEVVCTISGLLAASVANCLPTLVCSNDGFKRASDNNGLWRGRERQKTCLKVPGCFPTLVIVPLCGKYFEVRHIPYKLRNSISRHIIL